jgi:hypothetical protein
MQINFGKHKGKTVEELAQTQEGKAYLLWLTQQPTAGKYEALNKKRNEEILKILSLSSAAKVQPKYEKWDEETPREEKKQEMPPLTELITELKELNMCINELIKVLNK